MMQFGAAWYPEHWPESRWPEDIRLMREAGMTVIRIGEFAWSTLEPNESHYDFEWLDRAVELLGANGIAVVMGTPTAAPPAWLTHHHPDTLVTDPDGRLAQHGNRCHDSAASVTYLKYVRRIVEQMAHRFGPDERIIGWQIDNEYGRIDYSDNTRRQFQAYLRECYDSLDSLNQHWSTAYWSQTYNDWSEIPIPIGPHNPSLMLAFRRFITKVFKDFQKQQVDTIRQYALPHQWITHNFMGWFDGFDHYEASRDLDMASWDWYVGNGHHDYTKTGAAHDLTRGFKRKNFWVMETQPGSVNWNEVNNVLYRGEARCMAFHAAAHGADGFLYWQWRSALGGQEQYHGSLVGPDGRPRPFYTEAAEIGRDFKTLGNALDGTQPVHEVGILHSYDSRWAIDAQRHHKGFDPIGQLLTYCQPLAKRNIGVDIIHQEADLTGFKLVVVANQVYLSDAAAANITSFVQSGGTALITPRTGQKDKHNALLPMLQPGTLCEVAGVEVQEYYALDEAVPVLTRWSTAGAGEATIWAEHFRPLDAKTQVLAEYGPSNGWLDGGAAVTVHPFGKGRVVYVGACLDPRTLAELMRWVCDTSEVVPLADSPDGVEVAQRIGESGERFLFVINHNREPVHVDLEGSGTELISGSPWNGNADLAGYGVQVVRMAAAPRTS